MPMRIPDKTDVLVIGAGTGGCVAARRVAEAGRKAVLVERTPAEDVGRKICGNALGEDGLEAIEVHTAAPRGAEVACRLGGGVLVMQDGETRVPIPKSGIVLNRLVFGQRLLADAVSAGATLIDGCSCLGWADRSAGRVRLRSSEGEEADVTARIVVDASGYASVLTRDGGPSHPDALARADVGIGYREIVPLVEGLGSSTDAVIVLGSEGTRGGYAWVFPMGERLANIGIGAPLLRLGSGAKAAYRAFLGSAAAPATSAPIDAGTGLLPLRRPLASLVGDGFMSVGDAACQTNPLHGGGITPSIMGGGLAGETAVRALSDGDVSAEALWDYNVRFMRDVGARHAGHDFLRRILYSLPDSDFDFLTLEFAKAGVMLKAIAEGGGRLPLKDALRVIGKVARRPALVRLFIRAARLIERIQEIYSDYPDLPSRFESWIGRVEYERSSLGRLISGGGE